MKGSFIKKITAVLLAVTVVVTALAFTGCGAKGDDGSAKAAKVNDTVITQDQLDCFAKINMQLLGYDPSDITDDEEQELLNQLVVVQVVKEYYNDGSNDLYGDDYESAAKTFVDSAHESAADFLTQYEITDDQLRDFYSGQYAVSALFREIQEAHASDDMYALATEYYNAHKDEFKNDDGTYSELDDVIQSVYYALYSNMYDEKVTELKKDMKIKVY